MQHSGTLTKLATALTAAQSEIENAHKNALNPHFKNQYADLAEIINTVRPVLNKHGLAVVQLPGYEAGVTTVETILTHTSGEWLSGTAGSRVQKDDPQGVGSAITYLRRYSLAALCGIAQEDDDGEAASQPTKKAAPAKPATPATTDAKAANIQTARALWIEASGLGLEQSPDPKIRAGLASMQKAIDAGDHGTITKGLGWLRDIIELAKADGKLTGVGV